MSAPAVVSMLVIAAYNMVDAIFIGRFVGEMGLAALGSNIPAIFLLMGFSLFVGVGGSTAISRTLGKEDTEGANRILGTMMFMVLCLGGVSLGLAMAGTERFLLLLGTSESVLEPASQYLTILLYGGPLSIFTVAMNNVVRSEGNARMAMLSMVTGAVVNVLLDPVFIYYLDWGIQGAAWATVVAHLVTTLIMLRYLQSGKSSLELRWSSIRFHWPIVKEISGVGMSTLLMNSGATIIQSLVIRSLVHYGGEASVSIYAMCNRTMMFLFMPVFGIQAGVLPIIGYNYGAKLMKRVRHTIFVSIVLCTTYLMIGWSFVQLFPGVFIGAFTDDVALIEEGVSAIRKLSIAFPVVGIPIMIVGTFQAIGKAKYALFLTTNRTFILIIPLLLYLPTQLGADGVWFAFPIADSLALIVNSLFLWKVFEKFKD
ncbi:MAG: MATE family efflux transporter [Verrucomicrobia bacterium]|nr:MATE family efflux transporter [Verrucomicrobiota bacterium]